MAAEFKSLSRQSENTRSRTNLGESFVKKGGVNTGSSEDRPIVTINGQQGGCNTTQTTANPTAAPVSQQPKADASKD
jgi:hypothetical protein